MSENRTIVQHTVCVDQKTGETITVTRALPTDATATQIGQAMADVHDAFWHVRIKFGERADQREQLIEDAIDKRVAEFEAAGKKVDLARVKGEKKSIHTSRAIIQAQLDADRQLTNGHATEH